MAGYDLRSRTRPGRRRALVDEEDPISEDEPVQERVSDSSWALYFVAFTRMYATLRDGREPEKTWTEGLAPDRVLGAVDGEPAIRARYRGSWEAYTRFYGNRAARAGLSRPNWQAAGISDILLAYERLFEFAWFELENKASEWRPAYFSHPDTLAPGRSPASTCAGCDSECDSVIVLAHKLTCDGPERAAFPCSDYCARHIKYAHSVVHHETRTIQRWCEWVKYMEPWVMCAPGEAVDAGLVDQVCRTFMLVHSSFAEEQESAWRPLPT